MRASMSMGQGICCMATLLIALEPASAQPPRDPTLTLRLVPFPKEVKVASSGLTLRSPMQITINDIFRWPGRDKEAIR